MSNTNHLAADARLAYINLRNSLAIVGINDYIERRRPDITGIRQLACACRMGNLDSKQIELLNKAVEGAIQTMIDREIDEWHRDNRDATLDEEHAAGVEIETRMRRVIERMKDDPFDEEAIVEDGGKRYCIDCGREAKRVERDSWDCSFCGRAHWIVPDDPENLEVWRKD